MKLLSVLVLISTLTATRASDLKPFKSDGCSSFPDGTIKEQDLWLDCCYQHDLSYWQGGTADQRKQADQELKQCVAKVGKPLIAQMMLAGVRVGGSPYWPTPFRWAYGWPYLRGYKALSTVEQAMVDAELKKIPQPSQE